MTRYFFHSQSEAGSEIDAEGCDMEESDVIHNAVDLATTLLQECAINRKPCGVSVKVVRDGFEVMQVVGSLAII